MEVRRRSFYPGHSIKLSGVAIKREQPGMDFIWKMENIEKGFNGMAGDLKMLGQQINRFNKYHVAPNLRVSDNTVFLFSLGSGKRVTFNTYITLQNDKTLSVVSEQREMAGGKEYISLNISGSGIINNKYKNDRPWECQNPLLAIKMAVINEPMACNAVAFHLLLNPRAYEYFNDERLFLWPIVIRGFNEVKREGFDEENWLQDLRNENHALFIPW